MTPFLVTRKCGRNIAILWIRARCLYRLAVFTVATILVGIPYALAEWPEPLALERESMYAVLNQGSLRAADDLLRNVWPARGFAPVELAWPLSWNEDPYNDAYWRFLFYSLRYTSNLLWAYGKTGESAYRERLVEILRSYANYDALRSYDRLRFDNKHAAAYRAMVLVNTYSKLERWGELPVDLAVQLRESIENLGIFLFAEHNYEPTFNHGFNEAAALLLVAHAFPDFPDAASWQATAVQRLKEMVSSNIDDDGVDIENSPFYHYYVLGIIAQIAHWANAYEPALAPEYDIAQREMLPYAAAIVRPDGRLPMLGATAWTIVPAQDPAVYGHLTQINPAFSWVFSNGASGTPPSPGVDLFPVSGLFLLRSKTPNVDNLTTQTFLTFDSGIYRTNHSHLDALGITYFSDSTALIPESGLYTYVHGADFDYFHGTRAHNTVVVDGLDQKEGAAMPGAYGVVGNSSWATGTSRLYDGVTHTRTLILLQQDLAVVVDRLFSLEPHRYTQTWHLVPEATLQYHGKNTVMLNPSGTPKLAISQADWRTLDLQAVKGQDEPIQGWLSPRYGSKTPNLALEYERTATHARFVTLIASGQFAAVRPSIRQAWLSSERGRRIWVCAKTASYTITLIDQGLDSEQIEIKPHGGCPPLPTGRESMYIDLNNGNAQIADDLLLNIWPARNASSTQLAWPLNWTEDPYNDAYWRFMFYSLRHTSNLLWAYGTTREIHYRNHLVDILRSYAEHDEKRAIDRRTFDNNHAAAYRAMVLVNTYRKLQQWNELPADLAEKLHDSLERTGRFLFDERHFDPGSSLGFTEAAALLLIADIFPEMPEAANWWLLGIERLNEMMLTNIDADGVQVEDSPFYHYHVLGIITQIANWASAYQPTLATKLEEIQSAMLSYAAAIVRPDGRLPMLGATATTMVPALAPTIFEPIANLDPAFAWVFTQGAWGDPQPVGVRFFPTSGLFLLRSEIPPVGAQSEQTFITFDSGSYRTRHSHLDALSITYFSDGAAQLPDSGLFTYEKGAEFDYFHGTRAHNTVVVDGIDQMPGASVPGAYGNIGSSSWATGTSELYAGVRHVRTVAILEQGLALVIDRLTSDIPHQYVQTWHLFPDASLRNRGKDVTLLNSFGTPQLALRQADWRTLSLREEKGAADPIQGWISSAYGTKSPNWTLEYSRRAANASFVTLIASGPFAATRPTVQQAWQVGENRRIIWVNAATVSYKVTLIAQGAVSERLEIERTPP